MRISDWSSDVCSSDLIEARRRRLLDHLLMASLRRTVALEEVHGVAVVVAEDLHLDMARRRQAALQQDMLVRSEEHTSELQSLMRISYAVFCLKKKTLITITASHISNKIQHQHIINIT